MSCSTSGYTRWDAVVADGDDVCKNLNPLQGLTLEGPKWWNKDLCTQNRTENGCSQDCERMKILGLMLATTKNRTETSAAGARCHNHHTIYHCYVQNYCYLLYTCNGRHNENGMECGKCKWREKILWWGEKFPRLLLGVMDVNSAGLIITLEGDWGVQSPWELLPFKL